MKQNCRISIDDSIKGLIFDCDGTLVDNMPLHYQAWVETLTPYRIEFPEELFYQLAGVPGKELVRLLAERSHVTVQTAELVQEKIRRYLQLMPQAKPIEPVVEIIRKYTGLLPLAVASGGYLEIVEKTIELIGLGGCFSAIVTAKDVANHKPAPDTFVEAARRLQVPCKACLVFEDGDLGLEAARRAGMRSVDIRCWLQI
ncbi:MAG TPA: HAD-IA family hydrolase [bacterium]|nr:HAD-IA family hydrolase [bacterium]